MASTQRWPLTGNAGLLWHQPRDGHWQGTLVCYGINPDMATDRERWSAMASTQRWPLTQNAGLLWHQPRDVNGHRTLVCYGINPEMATDTERWSAMASTQGCQRTQNAGLLWHQPRDGHWHRTLVCYGINPGMSTDTERWSAMASTQRWPLTQNAGLLWRIRRFAKVNVNKDNIFRYILILVASSSFRCTFSLYIYSIIIFVFSQPSPICFRKRDQQHHQEHCVWHSLQPHDAPSESVVRKHTWPTIVCPRVSLCRQHARFHNAGDGRYWIKSVASHK